MNLVSFWERVIRSKIKLLSRLAPIIPAPLCPPFVNPSMEVISNPPLLRSLLWQAMHFVVNMGSMISLKTVIESKDTFSKSTTISWLLNFSLSDSGTCSYK